MHQLKKNNLINQDTLSDQVFKYLSNLILSGELQAGQRLIETDISEKLGISRGPVRDALAELERQGLAYSEVRRGSFVRPLEKADLWEIATLRATLEVMATKLAVPNITDDDLAFLEHLVKEMENAEHEGDVERLIDLDFAFHGKVIERCPHKRLQEMLDNMRLQIRLFRVVTRTTDYVSYPDMHWTLLEALRGKDAEQVEQVIYTHIMESADVALNSLPDDVSITISLQEHKSHKITITQE